MKLELCGAVLGKRLRDTIQKEMKLEFNEVIHIVDSEIVHAMIRKQSYGFNTFAANRVGEIQSGTTPEEWHWVAGKPWLNVADLTTRGCSPAEMGEESIWQNGPTFLSLPEEQCLVRADVRSDVKIPESEFKQKFVGLVEEASSETLAGRFDLSRFSKWRLLVHTTARVRKLYDKHRKDNKAPAQITADDLRDAETFCSANH